MGLTPMMQQYLETHERVPDALLFYRIGDFYEMFFDDALTASKELEIALTGRDCGLEERAPMCGVPFHAAEGYIAKLVEKGHKVAVCEQMEDPALAKGLVKRDIIKVVSPGTIADGHLIKEKENNFLVSLFSGKTQLGLAYLDISTGGFYVTELPIDANYESLMDELGKINPAEMIVNPGFYKQSPIIHAIEARFNCMVNLYPGPRYELKATREKLLEQFSVYSLDSLGLKNHEPGVRAAGGLLDYVDETQKKVLSHINHLSFYRTEEFMLLDLSTRRNLELTQTLRGGEKRGSLLWVLDRTVTAMGGRMLRQWVEAPLISAEMIAERQNLVGELAANPGALPEFKPILSKVYDLERICGKVSFGTCNPKDMLALKQSISMLPQIRDFIRSIDAPELREKYGEADLLTDLYDLVDRGIDDDAPFTLKDGGVIKTGYNEEIDSYREAGTKGKDWIRDLEKAERERTGIKSLKVKYNRVFGYFIEVTKTNLDQVPEDYIRKQTLANAERFFTPELKDMETRILGAEERLTQLEYQLFHDIREKIREEITRIQKRAREVAELDALYALASVAIDRDYVKPEIAEDGVIKIVDGRHPVAEALMEAGQFISNDCELDEEDTRMMLITGPNMAGKSTYIRQVAIITLMAQIGSFVPARSAHIGIVDRIFTRVGASDDLTTGQSTFMVEMSEVSNILKNATRDSLVILDEIGRGTSTFDGISIAWAVVEHLAGKRTIGAKTLFATHYHELTELEDIKDGIKNYSIGVKETKNGVVFLRKIARGAADQSYGIEVAELAGFPPSVTYRAREILSELDKGETTYRQSLLDNEKELVAADQINFFSMENTGLSETEKAVLKSLKDLEINSITPMEAMNTLNDLRIQLKEDS